MANGGLFGGVARGLQAGAGISQSRRDLGMRERALGLQERTLDFEMKRQMQEMADERINNTMKVVGESIGAMAQDIDPASPGFFTEAIAMIESGGNYQAKGPVTDDGSRAYGKYQIMDFNVGPWTEEVLGRRMTPEEFLVNPQAQDQVAQVKFGQFVQEHGSVEDAASVWHSGVPLAQAIAEGRRDANISTAEYVRRFTEVSAGVPAKKIRQAVSPVVDSAKDIAQKVGRDPAQLDAMTDLMIESAPIGVDTAIQEGQAAAKKSIANVGGLMQAGLTRAQALVAEFGKDVLATEGAGGLDPEKKLDIEEGLRKEYTKLAGPFIDVRDAYAKIQAASANPSAAGDVSLLVAYMKMLDPGSVVREGEFATAEQAGGVPTRIVGLYNRILTGQRLTETQRQDFLSQATALFGAQEKQHQSLTKQFSGLAQKAGVDPTAVTIDLSAAEAADAAPADTAAASDGEVDLSGLPPDFVEAFGADNPQALRNVWNSLTPEQQAEWQ